MASNNVSNSVYRKLNAQNGTSDLVRNGDCVLRSWFLSNVAATARFVKLYNKINATSSDTPIATICVPATSSANCANLDWYFSTALSIRCTTLVADADDTAPTANDVIVHLGYSI